MINLFVDESRPCPPCWTPAKTINEAIRVLSTEEVSVVSLDYDIDLLVEVPSRRGTKTIEVRSEETFAAVARYIALMPEGSRPEVQYHTANPKGEAIMRDILDE